MFRPAIAACWRISVMPTANKAPAPVASLNASLAFFISSLRYTKPSLANWLACLPNSSAPVPAADNASIMYLTTFPTPGNKLTSAAPTETICPMLEISSPLDFAALIVASAYNSVPALPDCNPVANSLTASFSPPVKFTRLAPRLPNAIFTFVLATALCKFAFSASNFALFS